MTAAPVEKNRRNWLEWPGLETYARRLAVVNFIVWLALFGLAFGAVFLWMNEGGEMSWEATLALCAWSGFFAGLVGYYSATLQTRKMLLLALVRPEAGECPPVRAGAPPPSLRLWWPALGWALFTAAAQTLFMLLLSSLGDGLGYSASPYLFYTALLPALGCAFLAWQAGRGEGVKFILLRMSGIERRLSMLRYIYLHSVLPYALVSAAVGLITAGARLWPQLTAQKPAPAAELAEHFALTLALVGLLLPAAARLKVRVDRLSPLDIDSRPLPAGHGPYHWWLAPLLAVLLWAALRLLGDIVLPAAWWLAAKGLLCFAGAFFFCAQSVCGALREQPHPYFELSRRLYQKRQQLMRSIDDMAKMLDK